MERWIPLFEIFLNSPSPEGEASLWFFQHSHREQSKHPRPTSAFLSLLLSPTATDIIAPLSEPTARNRCMLQTLPFAMQSRILSFLTVEARRFPAAHLRSIAIQIIDSYGNFCGGDTQRREEFFWVIKAARNLLDVIPSHFHDSSFDGLNPKSVNKNNEGEKEESEEDFDSLPDWLKNAATAASNHLLPWLPMSQCDLRRKTQDEITQSNDKQSEEEDNGDDLGMYDVAGLDEITLTNSQNNPQTVLCPQIHKRAVDLRARLRAVVDTLTDSLCISRDIQTLCIDAIKVGGGGRQGLNGVQSVLSLIEPWELDDEASLIVSSQLLDNAEMIYSDWPTYVFSTTILPKLFLLNQPASRVLMASTLEFCKNHQSVVSRALLLPLLHHKEGINSPMCDVIAKVAKESLHPSQAAAFFHGLLSMDVTKADFICVLPCHRDMISYELVWSEWLFSLFQHILSSDITLTPDSIDRIVSAAESVGCMYSKSLKFCSFLLCLVSNSKHALKFHKLLLIRVAEKTNTFLTKSVLSKLSDH